MDLRSRSVSIPLFAALAVSAAACAGGASVDSSSRADGLGTW